MQKRNATWMDWFRNLLLLVAIGAYTELALHLCIFRSVGLHIVYPILFGIAVGAVMALVVSLLPVWLGRLLSVILTVGYVLLAETQFIYHAIFGDFLSMSMMSLGGGVLESFSEQLRYALRHHILGIVILALPVVLLIAMLITKRALSFRMRWPHRFMTLLMIVVLTVGSVELMVLAEGEPVSALNLLRSQSASTDVSYQHLGMTATTVQELRFMLFGGDSGRAMLSGELTRNTYSAREYNVISNLDFAKLYDETDDPELRALDSFLSGREPTKKNEYTGALKGYNLITICAESFSPRFISEELTPALYKMTHQDGFLFENFYGTFQSVTTNGEYTFCLGLFPDLTRTKTSSSFNVSAANYLPYALGNILGDAGYTTLGYHNYVGHFYNRNITHPNMGYDFKTPDNGLNMEVQTPSSDLDMMKASLPDYIDSDDPFHVYYMTYSGHYQYSWDNDMSAKNRAAVEGLPYTSETVKAFVACNLELEYALEYLLDELEAAGQLDHTCIVLTNDHYPYGLTEAEYNDLAGEPVDPVFERYHNSFICYAPGLKETIPVENYCCTADILPTILNLFGLKFDSRLLAGVDALSDAEHIAILSDESFLTENVRYDAATGNVITADGSELEPEELQRLRGEVADRFTMSTRILNTDYYSHVFGSEMSEGEDETIRFEDLDARDDYGIYYQAAVSYLYDHDLVTPIREDYYGVNDPETIARFVDTLYRMAGSPSPDPTALPEGYGKDEDGKVTFKPGDEGYDAICWAFETGVMKDGDDFNDPDGHLGHQICARLLYRYAILTGLIEPPTDADIAYLRSEFPDAGSETLRAIYWCFDDDIIGAKNTPKDLMALGNEVELTRGHCATYLFRVATLKTDDA